MGPSRPTALTSLQERLRARLVAAIPLGSGLLALAMVLLPMAEANAQVATRFSSSFETARGTSNAARLDGGVWSDVAYKGLTAVVGAENGVTPVDGQNMFRVGVNDETNDAIYTTTAFDITADNNYARFYVNLQCISQDVSFTHYFEDFDGHLGLADSNNFYWTTSNYHASTGRYQMGWQGYTNQNPTGSGCNGNGNYLGGRTHSWGTIQNPSPNIESNFDPNGLQCGEWYRVEIHIECLDSGCWNQGRQTPARTRLHQRVYDSTGRQVLGNGQFRNMTMSGQWQGGTAGITIEDAYDENGYDTCWYTTAGRPSLFLGNNGQAGTRAQAEAWMYFDAVATSTEGWIGPVDGSGSPPTAPPPEPEPEPTPGPLPAPDFLP